MLLQQMTTMIDIGVNLSSKQFNGYHEQLLEHAYDAYIEAIIAITNNRKEWDTNIAIINKYKEYPVKIYTTLGIHPHSATDMKKTGIDEELLLYVRQNKENVVAIGECGLDFNRNFCNDQDQINAFKQQIELAIQLHKPLYLHDRDASKDMIRLLTDAKKSNPSLTAVVHCFTSNETILKQYLDLGFSFGITGWICDTNRNKELINAVKNIPLSSLMIETDAPWLTPYQYRKEYNVKTNEPDSLSYIVSDLANYTGYSEEEIMKASTENAKKFFSLPCC